MVMWEFLKSLDDDIGKDVRIQFWDDRGDFAFDGKIVALTGDRRIMIFEHNPFEAEKMNAKRSKINLEAVIIRGVDYLTMPTVKKMKTVEEKALGSVACPQCKTKIHIVNPKLLKEEN